MHSNAVRTILQVEGVGFPDREDKMNKRVLPLLVAGSILTFVLGGCDPITPPFMRNGLSGPIEVKTAYSNGVITDDVWQSGMEVACGRKDATIAAMTIKAQGAVIHQLRALDIRRMERSVPDMRKVVWEIRKTEIVPLKGH